MFEAPLGAGEAGFGGDEAETFIDGVSSHDVDAGSEWAMRGDQRVEHGVNRDADLPHREEAAVVEELMQDFESLRVHVVFEQTGGSAELFAREDSFGEVFADELDTVDAEAGDAVLKSPKVNDVLELGADIGVVPIEVGLGGVVDVGVELLAFGVPGEGGGSVEHSSPPEVFVGPVVIVGVFGIATCGKLEPGVLVGGVIENEIGDDADIELVDCFDEMIEIVKSAEARVDVGIVGDIIAAIDATAGVEGGEPDIVDAEVLDTRKVGSHAAEAALIDPAKGIHLVEEELLVVDFV